MTRDDVRNRILEYIKLGLVRYWIEKGTLDVKLSYEEIIPGQLTTLKTDFINPQTQKIQEHIDWRF